MAKLDPPKSMGFWRATEGAWEITVPAAVTGGAWVVAYMILSAPSSGRGITWVEQTVILGACCALTGWMASRQLYMANKKKPWTLVFVSLIYMALILFGVSSAVSSAFQTSCKDQLKGQLVPSTLLVGRDLADITPDGPPICRVGGVPDNPYLPGTIIRPSWDGSVHPVLVVFLALVTAISSLGLRTQRVQRTMIGSKLLDLLRYAPSQGAASGMGKPKVSKAEVQACANATMWGEICGQMYSKQKVFEPGEWCGRCHQEFTPGKRELRFKVVSLFGGEIDVLNGLERIDTVSWSQGEPIPPDARISGEERWVVLGDVVVPDVISVAQLLSLVHDLLPVWAGAGNPRVKAAAVLAMRRSSRVSAWFWSGSLIHRLTFARPNQTALLALGSARLRDMIPESGDELWLQLDIGLLPIEIRTGFRKEIGDGVPPRLDNNKVDIWIPVAPPVKGGGVWVPRVEGDALRLWLSTDRLRSDRGSGMAEPLPYYRYLADQEIDKNPPMVKPGSLDFVRVPLEGEGREPKGGVDEKGLDRMPGDSIADWEWLEPEQIQLLRQQCVVLTTR